MGRPLSQVKKEMMREAVPVQPPTPMPVSKKANPVLTQKNAKPQAIKDMPLRKPAGYKSARGR